MGRLRTKVVTNAAGTTNIVTVATAFTSAPEKYSMWLLSASDLVPEQWRVVSISENASK
jgi:predicted phage tail protein